jgi:hypothetical protein
MTRWRKRTHGRRNDENQSESAARVSISRSTQLVKQQNDGRAPKRCERGQEYINFFFLENKWVILFYPKKMIIIYIIINYNYIIIY